MGSFSAKLLVKLSGNVINLKIVYFTAVIYSLKLYGLITKSVLTGTPNFKMESCL